MTENAGGNRKDIIPNTVQTLTLAGLGLYSAIRFGQQVYCNAFGVVPEEIGLTYVASISRAAVVLVALTAPVVLIVSLISLSYIVQASKPSIDEAKDVIAFVIILAAAFLSLSVASSFGDFGYGFLAWGGIIVIGVPYMWSLYIRRRKNHESLFTYRQDHLALHLYQHRVTLALLALITALIVSTFLVTGLAAGKAIENTRVGRGVGTETQTGLGILGIFTYPAKLTGNLPKEPNLNRKALVYLGHSSGTIVLYDVKCSNVIRIPKEGVTIEQIDKDSFSKILGLAAVCPQ